YRANAEIERKSARNRQVILTNPAKVLDCIRGIYGAEGLPEHVRLTRGKISQVRENIHPAEAISDRGIQIDAIERRACLPQVATTGSVGVGVCNLVVRFRPAAVAIVWATEIQ